jgi:predicted nucleic acid-binding protein
MNIVVDTNIVFSAILNANGLIGDILFNSPNKFCFVSPELMIEEITRYRTKLIKASKLNNEQFEKSLFRVLSQIELISEEIINPKNWSKAYELTRNIDEDDTPFVALSLEIDGILWTGDKKLIKGLNQKNWQSIKSSKDLQLMRGY